MPAKKLKNTAIRLHAVKRQAFGADKDDSPRNCCAVTTTVGSRHPCGPIFPLLDSTFRYAGVYTAVYRVGSRDVTVWHWLGRGKGGRYKGKIVLFIFFGSRKKGQKWHLLERRKMFCFVQQVRVYLKHVQKNVDIIQRNLQLHFWCMVCNVH